MTMLLCVWTAKHMNIDPKESTWKPMVGKMEWAVIGILVPEVVLCAALQQYQQARWICKQLDEVKA